MSGSATGPSGTRDSWLFDTNTRTRPAESSTVMADRYGIADGGDAVATLDRSIPSESQVVFCTPCSTTGRPMRQTTRGVRTRSHGRQPRQTVGDVRATASESTERRLDTLRGTVRVGDGRPRNRSRKPSFVHGAVGMTALDNRPAASSAALTGRSRARLARPRPRCRGPDTVLAGFGGGSVSPPGSGRSAARPASASLAAVSSSSSAQACSVGPRSGDCLPVARCGARIPAGRRTRRHRRE